MIYILKSKAGFRVRYTGKNGEILAVSEVLTSKQNAWKNVRAMMIVIAIEYRTCYVMDGEIKYRCYIVDKKLIKKIN